MIYFDCAMGAAGDMLCSALYEILDKEQQNAFLDDFASLGIPSVSLTVEKITRCGIQGTHFRVAVNGEEEDAHNVNADTHNDGADIHNVRIQSILNAEKSTHNHEECTHNAEANTHNAGDCTHNVETDIHNVRMRSILNAEEYIHNAGDCTHNAEASTHIAGECTHNAEGGHTKCMDAGHSNSMANEHPHDKAEHHHATLSSIEDIITHLNASERVKTNITEVYRLIAAAESAVHGVETGLVHFHEVGAMDAVADVASFALLMERLGWPAVTASAVNVGSGCVRCAHGTLPVPAPATAYLLRSIPFYKSSVDAELCTPTGAALLHRFVSAFDEGTPIIASKIGYGMGSHEMKVCNCLRAYMCTPRKNARHSYQHTAPAAASPVRQDASGYSPTVVRYAASGYSPTVVRYAASGYSPTADELSDEVGVLECEIDDMTGEAIGFACDRLIEEGVLDVHTAPVYMKKGRPGVSLTVLCNKNDIEKTIPLIFSLTTTLGIRQSVVHRRILSRQGAMVKSGAGDIRIKTAAGYGTKRCKCEADDIARLARERNTSFMAQAELVHNSTITH